LLPLVIFIVAGLSAIDPALLTPDQPLTVATVSSTGLLLIFGFGGYEVVPVPAGEAKDPTRAVPFALVLTIVIVTLVMTLAQVVAVGTLPGLAKSSTPLADSAAVFLGGAGAALMTLGATASASGNNMGQALSGPRNLYALAEHGDLPAFFGRVHRNFRTPVNAIVVTSAVALALALSGTFAALAAASAISRLIVYVFTCAATLRLRRPAFAARVRPATFVVPGGPVIPSLAIVMACAILAGATGRQLRAGALALFAGAILYLVALRSPTARAIHANVENQ
jgi:amino acid transporter